MLRCIFINFGTIFGFLFNTFIHPFDICEGLSTKWCEICTYTVGFMGMFSPKNDKIFELRIFCGSTVVG